MAAPTADDLLRNCQRSAVHLEMRDGYMLDDPGLSAWRQGHRFDPGDRAAWRRPWYDLTQQVAQRGVAIRRARIVSEPVSEYIRYEYDMTFANVLSGEDVRWLRRRQATDIALPGNDFWLFDGEILLVNHFSGNGDWIGSELAEGPYVVRLCVTAFEAVWARAIPHRDYRPL